MNVTQGTPIDAALAKVQHLVQLALDTAAAPGEACNAALAALKLVRKHGLEIVAPLSLRAAPEPIPYWQSYTPPQPGRRRIWSRYEGRCRSCGDPHGVGDPVWFARDRGCVCEACNEAGE